MGRLRPRIPSPKLLEVLQNIGDALSGGAVSPEFVEFTSDGELVGVVAGEVVLVETDKDGTKITLKSGNDVTVDQTPREVIDTLSQ